MSLKHFVNTVITRKLWNLKKILKKHGNVVDIVSKHPLMFLTVNRQFVDTRYLIELLDREFSENNFSSTTRKHQLLEKKLQILKEFSKDQVQLFPKTRT